MSNAEVCEYIHRSYEEVSSNRNLFTFEEFAFSISLSLAVLFNVAINL